MNNLENINGGYPPIQMVVFKDQKSSEKKFSKERAMSSSSNNVNIRNIIKTKKTENILNNKKNDLEIIDSL
jgi:hypothetical protein